MGLVEDSLLLALVVHLTDALFPLRVGARDSEANVGDHIGVVQQDPLAYCPYKGTTVSLVGKWIGQLGLSFQLLEV